MNSEESSLDHNVDLNKFVSDSPVKTHAMAVRVISPRGEIENSFVAPEGFQLDSYARYLHPDCIIKMSYNKGKFGKIIVNLKVKKPNILIKQYSGIYQRKRFLRKKTNSKYNVKNVSKFKCKDNKTV